jgi:error-prone DNA polymerase
MRNVEHLPPTETQRERSEWEVLALNVSRHPLSPYRTALRDSGVTTSEGIRKLPHGTRARAAGLLECLQCPPTKSGRPVWFLLIEDEWGLLQATIFRGVYEKYGDLLHHRGSFFLEGRVENTPKKGFSFLVERVRDLREVLSGAKMPTPKTASEAFLRAGRRGRRVG